MPRAIQLIVIHCTASKNGDSLFRTEGGVSVTPAQIVDRWHRERGFARKAEARARLNPDLSSIGYHWLIQADGARTSGRAADEPGAHAVGYNANSLGIALVGTDAYTPAQWATLAEVVQILAAQYRIPLRPVDTRSPAGLVGVCGHNEIPDVKKACPGFSVRDWINRGLAPLARHVQRA